LRQTNIIGAASKQLLQQRSRGEQFLAPLSIRDVGRFRC